MYFAQERKRRKNKLYPSFKKEEEKKVARKSQKKLATQNKIRINKPSFAKGFEFQFSFKKNSFLNFVYSQIVQISYVIEKQNISFDFARAASLKFFHFGNDIIFP